jgi:glutamyl-tRNA synthetase
MPDIVTRFAPSPTGFLHVGGVRTALFAWLVARQAGGTFILRIEDTDKNREVEGSIDHIIECLQTLGIDHDFGPGKDGHTGPYKQSERLETYHAWALKLVEQGKAYADPYSPEELNHFREQAQAAKQPFLYRNHRPDHPPTWDGKQPLRFKSDPKPYIWNDEVMGDLKTGPEVIDDFILIKSDGYPTYNFAHIVDDAEMGVTHVIRGQEFLSSMPNYLNLYEALGVQRPVFATMPHIMNEQGNKKLSKRDGAKDILDYTHDGYLPETMMSFIATLGWNDGTQQEVFTRDELIEKFSLSRVGRSGARFDEKRLLWMNGQMIRDLSLDDLYGRVADFWPESAAGADEAYKKQVLALAQDRLKTLRDLPSVSDYFFREPEQDWSLIEDNKQLKKLEKAEIMSLLDATYAALAQSDWTPEAIQDTLNQLLQTTGQKPGILFSLIRTATTWAPFSPQLNDTLALIGRERTLERLKKATS